MRLSTAAGRYGVRAMYELAIRYGVGPVAGRHIAQRQNISLPYLDQLMSRLRRGGLVRSVRGPQGGYLLARSPARIKVGDIVRCVEGPIKLFYCLGESGVPRSCAKAESCVSRILLKKLNTHIMDALDSTTLEDLCKEAGRISCPVARPQRPLAKAARGRPTAGRRAAGPRGAVRRTEAVGQGGEVGREGAASRERVATRRVVARRRRTAGPRRAGMKGRAKE